MPSTHPTNNNASRVGEMSSNMIKHGKIGNIVANTFLSMGGESCHSPSYKIPDKYNSETNIERILSVAAFRVNAELIMNPNLGQGCEVAESYKREVRQVAKREILKNYIRGMFETPLPPINNSPSSIRQVITLNNESNINSNSNNENRVARRLSYGGRKRKTIKKRSRRINRRVNKKVKRKTNKRKK